MAGAVPRAPQWVRMLRMEWLYRVIQEPRRLGFRYFIGMPLFLLRVGRQWIAGPRIPNTVSE
jgi:UDP-N-acetyl-D-mannosaminuronic acid transferase (WecB/TagA/CpsF family)